MRPPLFCDICGEVMKDTRFFACRRCRDEELVPTNESLARASVLNAPYWRWRSEEADFERVADAQGFKVMGDGSILAYQTLGEKHRLEDINAYHI